MHRNPDPFEQFLVMQRARIYTSARTILARTRRRLRTLQDNQRLELSYERRGQTYGGLSKRLEESRVEDGPDSSAY